MTMQPRAVFAVGIMLFVLQGHSSGQLVADEYVVKRFEFKLAESAAQKTLKGEVCSGTAQKK
jgi:hypothetical protein